MEIEKQRFRPNRQGTYGNQAVSHDAPKDALMASTSPNTKTAIARSMSRYRGTRPKPPRSNSHPLDSSSEDFHSNSPARYGTRRNGDNRPSRTSFHKSNPNAHGEENSTKPTKLAPASSPKVYRGSEEPLRQLNLGPSNEMRKPSVSHQYYEESKIHISGNESDDIVPSKLQGIAHAETPASLQARYDKRKQGIIVPEGTDSFRQPRRDKSLATKVAAEPKKSFTQRMVDLVAQPQSRDDSTSELKRMISPPFPIDQNVNSPSPAFDAPKSAVNAGQRNVMVKFEKSFVQVPVTPSTTPVDVVRSVSDQTGIPIRSDASVVLEAFKQLGLERPLRRYEHVRDVLNSWDNDSQNSLVIESSVTGGIDNDLDVTQVSKQQPDESTFYLYHSQRPGHWDKRWISVRSDGQMQMAKSAGGETSNICHLSDFDIYIPTHRQLAKKIRPPKKICFAVKSQQKSSIFMSTANFVHFFSSSDKKIANSLYKAVQGWRSWYLVNIMGEGQNANRSSSGRAQNRHIDEATAKSRLNERNSSGPTGGTSSKTKAKSLPKIRTNQEHEHPSTLISPERRIATGEGVPISRHQHESGSAASVPLASPRPKQRSLDIDATARDHRRGPGKPTQKTPPEPFAAAGLLGRTYSQRKRAQQEREREAQVVDTTNTTQAPEPSPLRDPQEQASNTHLLKRASSQRQKIKPLVDLTPKYHEPPQHSRKGRGVNVQHIPAGGLVDIATSPEVAIPIPPPVTWRRPGTSSSPDVSPHRAAPTARGATRNSGNTNGGQNTENPRLKAH
ncbi:MAG: hypothetical protein LQ351_005376 [Letrouitia transgressa]|nr:MAG: hypothetical protein LQ351_005376 [Letrouitia transgressa]